MLLLASGDLSSVIPPKNDAPTCTEIHIAGNYQLAPSSINMNSSHALEGVVTVNKLAPVLLPGSINHSRGDHDHTAHALDTCQVTSCIICFCRQSYLVHTKMTVHKLHLEDNQCILIISLSRCYIIFDTGA